MLKQGQKQPETEKNSVGGKKKGSKQRSNLFREGDYDFKKKPQKPKLIITFKVFV